ncbi:MAG: preprotein translocase subunit SecG [Clostridia bacterium]|nr:preprotein translocase subunit SecG [Oscillospiraceae bacterium]MBQ7032623.1 preprotein translocase subunit SecG [Clostridia bacterium]
MGTWKMVCTIVHIVVSVCLIAVVLLQSGKDAGLSGTIAGSNSDSFFGKNRGRTLNGILEKWTAILAVVFIILSVVLAVVFE